MSLARNPSTPYRTAGRQIQQADAMQVRAHVHAPASEACEDNDGRTAYSAPDVARSREPFTLSFKTVLIVCSAVVFVLAMVYVSALARRAEVYKAGQEILAQMDKTDAEILEMKAALAQEQAYLDIRYEAAQRIGMESSLGKDVIVVNAPETRPAQAGNSLPAEGSVRASAD
ncbi:MAG: hypothetical protein IJS53_04415 [Clostridia bacterium]|nr:hypothetical protein [Clostridia bacterium]